MRQRAGFAKLVIVAHQTIAFRLNERPAISTRRKLYQGLQLHRFRRCVHLFKRPERGVDAVKVVGHPCRSDGVISGFCRRNILIPDFCDHRGVSHFLAGRARPARFSSTARNLTALVEIILNKGARGVAGVKVEFGPELIELRFTLLVQDKVL